jgi:DNA end-binding protein Ku
MPRALKNLDITLGLAVIPVQLFTATSSQGVAFHLLHAKCGSRIQMRLECPNHGIVPREETVRGYEIAKDEYVRFEPEELKALEQASSSALVIDSFVPEGVIDPVYFEDTYYLGAGKNGERGYRVLVQALERTHRIAVGTFTWRGKTTPIAIRRHQNGLLLQRLYFAEEVHSAAEIDRGADPKIRDQERTLAERLISELSATEFHPENYEDEYRKRLLKRSSRRSRARRSSVWRWRPGPPRPTWSRPSRRASDGKNWRRRHARGQSRSRSPRRSAPHGGVAPRSLRSVRGFRERTTRRRDGFSS